MCAQLSDWDLIRALADRRSGALPRAWAEWSRRHERRAAALAGRILKRFHLPADLTDDALQQGGMRFLSHLHYLDPGRQPFPYYLRTIRSATMDLVRRELRHRAHPRRLPLRMQCDSPAEQVALRDCLETLLDPLPPQQRELLRGRYLFGHSAAELAEQSGLTTAQVYRLLHVGRCMVRRQASKKLHTSDLTTR